MTSPEEALAALGVTPEMSAAYDILADDGVPPEVAARMAMQAERSWRDGTIDRTPEEFARHVVRLRRVARSEGGRG